MSAKMYMEGEINYNYNYNYITNATLEDESEFHMRSYQEGKW